MRATPSHPHLPFPWNSQAATQLARNQSADELGTPHCPVCGHPLVLRLGSRGPFFHCGCLHRRRRHSQAA